MKQLKQGLFFLSILLCTLCCKGQNLVPNPNFENHVGCPNFIGQVPISGLPGTVTVTDWMSPDGGSPDYYNSCDITGNAAVPYSTFMQNYQLAHSGTAYIGLLMYAEEQTSEHMMCQLKHPLTAGHIYQLHYYISATAIGNVYLDQIGAYFSDTAFKFGQNTNISTLTPQIESAPAMFFNDTLNWVEVTGTYVATGGERWIILGKFFHGNTLNHVLIPGAADNSPNDITYLLYDDVCLADVDSLITTSSDTTFCFMPGQQLTGRDSGQGYEWNTGDTTATITVTTSGTYWRSAFNDCGITIDSFHLTEYLPVSLGPDTMLCNGDSLIIASTYPATNYTWNTGATTATITVSTSGSYSVIVSTGACAGTDSINVLFQATPAAPVTKGATVCAGNDTFSFNAQGKNLLWYTATNQYIGTTAPTVPTNTPGTQTYLVTQTENGCTGQPAEALLTVSLCDGCLYMPTAFTPNGDGKNDNLQPVVSCPLKEYELEIFDRWGQRVFHSFTVTTGWTGIHSGHQADIGTYGWVIHYKPDFQGAQEQIIHGDALLIR